MVSRNPTLHITKSDLSLLLTDCGLSITNDRLWELFVKAKPYQIKNRYKINTNTRTAKMLEKSIDTDTNSVDLFQRLLISTRQVMGHKYIQLIKKSDSQYLMLKEVVNNAEEFTKLFEFKIQSEGFIEFIKLGLHLIGKKYGLNKFKYYKEKIFTYYEQMLELDRDEEPNNTKLFYEIWKALMLEYAGFEKELSRIDYVNMLYGRQEADRLNAGYEGWIEAQFTGLAWLNCIPELSQFFGENAVKRYEKYSTVLAVDKPKDGLPVSFDSEEEEEYYKIIRRQKT